MSETEVNQNRIWLWPAIIASIIVVVPWLFVAVGLEGLGDALLGLTLGPFYFFGATPIFLFAYWLILFLVGLGIVKGIRLNHAYQESPSFGELLRTRQQKDPSQAPSSDALGTARDQDNEGDDSDK